MTLNANNFGVSIPYVLALLLLRCHTYTLLTADGFFLSGRTTRIALHCPCHPEWQQYIVYNTLNWKQCSLLVYYCCFILLLWYLFFFMLVLCYIFDALYRSGWFSANYAHYELQICLMPKLVWSILLISESRNMIKNRLLHDKCFSSVPCRFFYSFVLVQSWRCWSSFF